MSKTELVDVVAMGSKDKIVLWVEKEVYREMAEEIVRIGNKRNDDRLYVLAPCGRYAKNDRYVAGDE